MVLAADAADVDTLESERMSRDMDVLLGGDGGAGASRVGKLAALRKWGMLSLVLSMGFALSAHAQTIVEYIHTDALGSPVATTDASGNVIERQMYEPYGAPVTHGASDSPGFTGHVQDAATDLDYMQQRYYDPDIGIFLSSDQLSVDPETGHAFGRYSYVVNNPFRYVDPDGRCEKTTGSNICGAGSGGSKLQIVGYRSPVNVVRSPDATVAANPAQAISGEHDKGEGQNPRPEETGAPYPDGRIPIPGVVGWKTGEYTSSRTPEDLDREGMVIVGAVTIAATVVVLDVAGGLVVRSGVRLLGPSGKVIGHPAYGGRTISSLRTGRVRFGWGRDGGPTLRLGIDNTHVDFIKLPPPTK